MAAFNTPSPGPDETARDPVTETNAWLEKIVIGLNLCPFAKAVHVKNQIRYVVSTATDTETLHAELAFELQTLSAARPDDIDTTLLIHPDVLTDFFDYNDFLYAADAALEELGFAGHIQIASFHPQYRFAGSSEDDIENYTNRSPYPMLHLLREESVEKAIEAFPDAAAIFDKNIETLRRLGYEGLQKLYSKN